MTSHVYLGIDLGGTKIEIIALDASGHSLYRTRTPTPKHPDASAQYQAIIPNSSQGKHKFIMADESAFINVSTLHPVNGNGSFTNPFTLNFANAYLIVTHKSLS